MTDVPTGRGGSSQIDDALLIRRAQQELPHGTTAFRVLVERYSGYVFARAKRLVGSTQDAEEIVQDVFLRVFRALPSFRQEKPFLHWLNTITTNTCKNQIRSRMREARKRSEFALEFSEQLTKAHFDPWFAQSLEEAMAELDPLTRMAVMLRHVDEASFPEIAEQLGIGESAAKMRVSRGLSKLRSHISERESKQGS